MSSESYKVKGMSCHGCERSVELAVAKAPGVESVKASAQNGTIEVQFKDEPVAEAIIREAVEKSGYSYAGK